VRRPISGVKNIIPTPQNLLLPAVSGVFRFRIPKPGFRIKKVRALAGRGSFEQD
jgi:hypothetical protein